MASLGGSQSSPDRRYTAQLPQLAATAKGPGLGTIKPMVTASKKTLSAQKIKTPAIKPDFRSTGEKNIKED